MSNRRDIQFTYNPHNKATLLDCNFVVDATAAAGLTGLNASGRIASVYMHSSSPSAANPNPQSGVIVVNLQDNYNKFLYAKALLCAPGSGSDLVVTALGAALTIGNVYTITVLGTTTTADWVTIGVPVGIVPAVGVSFIAAATGAGTGSGKVQVPLAAAAGVFDIELIGNPNLMNSSSPKVSSGGQGMQIILGCYKDSAGDAPVLAAPSAGSKIYLIMYLNNSAQGV